MCKPVFKKAFTECVEGYPAECELVKDKLNRKDEAVAWGLRAAIRRSQAAKLRAGYGV